MTDSIPGWHTEVEGGRWNANAIRLLKGVEPKWEHPNKHGSVLMAERKVIASVRRVGRGSRNVADRDPNPWHARLDGFEFRTIPGIGAARLGIKWSPIRGFPNARAAIKFIDQTLDTLKCTP